jgi:hypothetical protein
MDIWRPVMKNAVEPVVVAADHVETLLGRVLPELVAVRLSTSRSSARCSRPAHGRATPLGSVFSSACRIGYSPQTRNIGGHWL